MSVAELSFLKFLKMLFKKFLFIALLFWLYAAPAKAQTAPSENENNAPLSDTLKEVIVTGVPNATRLKDAFATYQIVTAAQMQAQGSVTVSDALRTQLNVNIGNDNQLGSNVSMQGMKGDKVKILLDGLPVNGRENGQIDLGQLMTNNVQRIEIVQGPMSVVYGSDALGGVINIITKKTKTPWGIEAGTYFESIGKYNFDAAGNYRFSDRHQLRMGGGRNFFDGWKPLDPMERSFLWLPKEQYFANAAYDYTAKSSFRLRFASDFTQEKLTGKDANYKISPYEAYAFDNYFHTTRLNNRLTLSGKAGKKGNWQSQNNYAFYYRTRNKYRKDLVTLNQQLVDENGAQDTTRFDDINLRGSYSNNAFKKMDYTVGYDVNLEHAVSGKLDTNARQNIQDCAAWVSASFPFFTPRLKVQPALRYTYNTAFKVPLIPSLQFLLDVNDAVQYRLSYSSGFRAPSLKELYLHFYDSNHEVEGNPNLLPERGNHFQTSLSWRFYQQDNDFAKLLFTGFYNDVFNQISLYQPEPVLRPAYAVYTNIAHLQNILGTVQAETQLSNLYVQSGFTFAHILAGGGNVKNSVQATANVQYSWLKTGLLFNGFLKYFGTQPNITTTVDGSSAYDGVISPYSMLDFSASRKFWKRRITFTVGFKNLLNVQSVSTTGASSGGVHSGGSANGNPVNNIAPGRSFFSSLRLALP